MKRLLKRVTDGHFQKEGGLRKGDELQHFFDAFIAMVESLRQRELNTIRRLDQTIAALEPHVEAQQLTSLRELRKDVQACLVE